MGQKVNPIGSRLGINRNWTSRWFPSQKVAPFNIGEDHKICKFIKKELYYAGISEIIIERTTKKIKITVIAARPGLIIGKKGTDIEKIKESLKKLVQKDVAINIKEVEKTAIKRTISR